MPFRLRRDDARFGELLADLADRLASTAGLLAELLGEPGPQLRGALPGGRAAEVAVEAVPRLQHPAQLTDSAVELNRLGRQAREAHRRFVVAVSADGADAALLVRRVTLAQSLRRAVESFEDLAHALQTVAVKEG